ncbi:hypothetical protein Mgra_00004120 [Meloidogyne graminicola]|uniref:Uncharacterized protein n=1 Tax=Meloidogyne graminicola TaxID=189291 RepID=A0A8S9ZTT9_9BILA|nr:hypothetical protein Mgra_00004120 [Meloidogyne graminicola]
MLSRDLDASARPPKGKLQKGKVGRKNKRLTDLDADDITDSDTDEWHESSADNVEEDPEPSEDEYLPSERRSKTRGMWSRHKSDDDFINDDSDPDYIDIGRNRGKKKNRRVSKAMNKRRNETSTSEDDNQIQHDMSDSDSVKSGRKSNKNKTVYSSDEKEMTETGRPLRKAAAKVGARLVEQSVDDEEDEEEEMDENDEKAHEAKSLKNETEDLNNGESILKSKTDFSHLTTHELDGLDENALIDDEEEFMPDEMEEVEADEEEEEAEVELENEAVDDENFEDESGDEDSSVSSDDGEEEEELTNKISKNEKIIQSSTKGKEKKLPPPRKTKRNKKKVGRVKGKTNKISNDKKIGLAREKITTSIQQTISHSPSKNIIDKNAIVSNTECLKSTLSDSQQLSSQHLTRQRYNPSTLIETKMSKFTNSDQQNSLESPTTSSNAEQQRIPSQSRKIELLLSIASSDVSKVQKKEFNISDSLLSNYVSSDRVIAIGKAKVNDISVDSTNSQIKTIEMSTKSKLESFVKEKSLPIMDKITVSASYPMNSSKSIPTSDVAALNIPLTSSKMSTTVFQPVNPQQLSQYFLCPSNTPSTSQKIDSTIHVSSSSPVVTSANLTTVLPTRIILQQRPMAPFITTSFPFFSNNTPPNVSSPQVAIMPSILPPQPITGGPTGCLSQFVPQQSTAYFMHQGAPPQVIYQTLQPYGTGLPQHVTFPTNQMQSHQINSQQTAGILDQESLSHALAGAMNPEDL